MVNPYAACGEKESDPMFGGLAAAAVAMTPIGDWVTEDRSAVVSITACGESLCGKVTKVLVTGPGVPGTDVHNPNKALRDRPILGLSVLGGFSQNGTGWSGGRIYDPKTGKSYNSRLRINGDGTLKVSGCVAIICENQRWTRPR